MYINYIGHNHIHGLDFEINRPEGSGDYLALLIRSHGLFTLNDKTFIIEPNTFFLYRKGTPQFYKAYNEKFSNDWFHFNISENEMDYFQKLHIPFETPIALDNVNPLSLIIKTMAGEKYSDSQFSSEIIQNYLNIFFMEISRSIYCEKKICDIHHYEEMALLRSKIYNKPYEKWTIQGLAHQINMSSSHFQRLYKKLFKISCIQDVINARIESAKYYLTETDFTIKHISEILGYENYEHFIRQFKNVLNQTPSEYRKLNTKNRGIY